MTEVGKSAKHAGELHPRVLRKIDVEPPKKVLKASGKKAGRKPFGYSYRWRWRAQYAERQGKNKWKRREHWTWYATEKQRDQAMREAEKGDTYREYGDVQPINRSAFNGDTIK